VFQISRFARPASFTYVELGRNKRGPERSPGLMARDGVNEGEVRRLAALATKRKHSDEGA
jgi:hypothetical protein